MPDVYISRVGMETKNLDAQFAQTELARLPLLNIFAGFFAVFREVGLRFS